MAFSVGKAAKAALSAVALAFASQATATEFLPAIEDFEGGTRFGGFSTAAEGETIGWSFSTTRSFLITDLGWFASDGSLESSHEVGIWTLDGILLVSALVQAGPATDDGFAYTSITPFELGQGSYLIGGSETLGDGDNYVQFADSLTLAPGITYLSAARSANGSGFAAPTITSNGIGRFGANFRFAVSAVPEPATWALLFLGFAGIGMMVRSDKARKAKRLRSPFPAE